MTFLHARLAAVQSRVAAPVVSEPRAPPPFLCSWRSTMAHTGAASALAGVFRAPKGFMRHITHHHTCSVVDEDTRVLFVAIERVTRSTPCCGGLRRSPVVGDIIVGLLGAPTAAAGVAGVEDGTAAPIPGARVELLQLHLPTDTQRIRLLPANTLLHIPSSCRLRMIAATAQCWQGMW